MVLLWSYLAIGARLSSPVTLDVNRLNILYITFDHTCKVRAWWILSYQCHTKHYLLSFPIWHSNFLGEEIFNLVGKEQKGRGGANTCGRTSSAHFPCRCLYPYLLLSRTFWPTWVDFTGFGMNTKLASHQICIPSFFPCIFSCNN